MTNEEKDILLEIAIKNYPIGTVFNPINSSTLEPSTSVYKVKQKPDWSSNDIICANGNLYVNGIWAPILSRPDVVNTFPIY
jgi:hypothetical protein